MKRNRTFFLSIIIFCFACCSASFSQNMKYINWKDYPVIGKGSETGGKYHRLDTAKYANLPRTIKLLYTNSSGLAVRFKTNSNTISVRWTNKQFIVRPNMTYIASSGLDLYIKRKDKWIYAGCGQPKDVTSESVIVENMEEGEKECLLYLPLYNELKDLEIGVTPDSYLEPLGNPFKGKVLIYGSSITQGASASRPGLAYPAILSRKYGVNFINLGLSGNGKMEKEAADMLADIEADVYILDCCGNPSPQQITERTGYLVRTIRERHPEAPIIMIQSVVRETENFNIEIRDMVIQQNSNFKAQYRNLKDSGIKELYLIESKNLLGTDHEGTADGTHPNDLGFDRMLKVFEPQIMKVVKKCISLE